MFVNWNNSNYWNCNCIWLASAKKLQSLQSFLTVVLQWSDRPGFTNRYFWNHTHCPFCCNQSNFLCQWRRLEFWIQLLSWRSNWPDLGRNTVHGTQLKLRWHYCSTTFSPCSVFTYYELLSFLFLWSFELFLAELSHALKVHPTWLGPHPGSLLLFLNFD